MRIIVIVQARTGSTRFPGKIMKTIFGKTLLELQMERMRSAHLVTDIIVATTLNKEDDNIVNLCNKKGYNFFRGNTNDLLDRHYKAALVFQADIVVKIPSDCPLIEPSVIDKVIKYYLINSTNYDFVSNLHPATYPDGNDVEVMPFEILQTAWNEAEKGFQLEHTTPYIWDNPRRFSIGNVEWETGLDYSMSHRFTIDYPEDFDFISEIYKTLYPTKTIFSLNDILNLLERNPELFTLNQQFQGVNWYRNHIGSLNTINLSMTNVI